MLSGMSTPRQESDKEAIFVCATTEGGLCIRIEVPEKARKVPRDMGACSCRRDIDVLVV